ncbi:L-psp endoribonuclease family protein [Thozetella sp. PMI_491]|nr:L-psp endoribonuclease family protein [Thozetella sp. PMI_491]
MPGHQTITATNAPAPNPVLSQATVYNGQVFCSGSLGVDPKTGNLVEGTIGDRTTQALKNLQAVLEAAGSGIDKVLKVMIYVTSISDVPALNAAYTAFFPEPRPARACVAVKELAKGTDVEIECVGYI